MSIRDAETLSHQNPSARRNSSAYDSPCQPVLVRLNALPATSENRVRILERVQRLNRFLEESGTPFRLRVL
jgi:hypothetical protein